MFLRLWVRAPRTEIRVAAATGDTAVAGEFRFVETDDMGGPAGNPP